MNMADLINSNISKKMAMSIAGAYFVRDIEDIYTACLVTGLLMLAIACQTIIDVRLNRKEEK